MADEDLNEQNETPVDDTFEDEGEEKDISQRTLDELTRQREEFRRANAAMLENLQRLTESRKQTQEAETEDSLPASPKRDDFQSYEEYLSAKERWGDEVLDKKLAAARKQIREEVLGDLKATESTSKIEAMLEKGRAKHEDFDMLIGNPRLRITEFMRDCLIETENGEEIAYHLASNPKEAARIASLSHTAAAMELAKIAAKIGSSDTPGARIKPVSGGGPPTDGLGDDLSIEEWIRRERARMRKRAGL